jgi:hypothetical protein
MPRDPELTPEQMVVRMEVLAERIDIRDERGFCPGCGKRFPAPPKPMVCEACDIVPAVPNHREWPPALKTWLLYQLVRGKFDLYRNKQDPWESLLRSAFTGPMVAPDGRRYPLATGADKLFMTALDCAADFLGTPEYRQFLTLILGTTDDVPRDA